LKLNVSFFLQTPDLKLQELIEEYKEEMYGCVLSPLADTPLMSCDSVPKAEIELRFQQDPHVSFVVKAVSALTAAFRYLTFNFDLHFSILLLHLNT